MSQKETRINSEVNQSTSTKLGAKGVIEIILKLKKEFTRDIQSHTIQ